MKLELIETSRTFRATDANGNEYLVEQNADGSVDVYTEQLGTNDFFCSWMDEVKDEEILTQIVLALSNIQ
jgi:hypothetical protein